MSAASKTTTASARKTTRPTTRKRRPSKLHPATALMTLATIAAATGAAGGDVNEALGGLTCDQGMKRRYRAAALRLHPDKNPDEDATRQFAALENAYQERALACAFDTTLSEGERQQWKKRAGDLKPKGTAKQEEERTAKRKTERTAKHKTRTFKPTEWSAED